MAGKKDIDFTYTTLDRIFRISIGETADFSAAMYNGNFSMTLDQAQKAKHEFIERELDIKKRSESSGYGKWMGTFFKVYVEQRG